MPTVVLVACWLCGHTIDSTPDRAHADGMDHALDEHRTLLLTDPDRVCSALTVSPPAPRPAWVDQPEGMPHARP